MEPTASIDVEFHWDKVSFQRLKNPAVMRHGQQVILQATDPLKGETWSIVFVQDQGQWKVDDILGYSMPCMRWGNWEHNLLPQLKKYHAKGFDLYYFVESFAEKNLKSIIKERKDACEKIAAFLGVELPSGMRIILFPNQDTKYLETGHQGKGWAYNNTIVEVYNQNEKLDPFHEITHVLAKSFGNPPALFREGLAVYLSERFGSFALDDLGGGTSSILCEVSTGSIWQTAFSQCLQLA
jgi:hypothetical protein